MFTLKIKSLYLKDRFLLWLNHYGIIDWDTESLCSLQDVCAFLKVKKLFILALAGTRHNITNYSGGGQTVEYVPSLKVYSFNMQKILSSDQV